MEYLRVFRDASFSNVVVSLKSSDCRMMVEAVRLLARQMEEEGIAFPLHLGVTEAGEGEDGRVRSAVGIGTLLNEGLGDTIRVSLTEPPEREIPVARELIKCCIPRYRVDPPVLPGRCSRPFVVAGEDSAGEGPLEMVYARGPGGWMEGVPAGVPVIVPVEARQAVRREGGVVIPYMDAARFLQERVEEGCVEVRAAADLEGEMAGLLAARPGVIVVVYPPALDHGLYRAVLEEMYRREVGNRVIARAGREAGDSAVAIASQVGGLFIDRLADGLWVTGYSPGLKLGEDILQSAGVRRYKTEFISCPGCGRTLFNLQDSVREVKRALSCFPRLKIAVMGCVVNGPGEMGDADYGYVGAGRGKVTLYKGGAVARANVAEGEAVEELRKLIVAGMEGYDG